MTVIVTKMPGGIAQMFTPETGKITYKCKGESTYMEIEAFGGIVKFLQKGSKAIVAGPATSLENCEVIKPDDPKFNEVRKITIRTRVKFKEEQISQITDEINELKKAD